MADAEAEETGVSARAGLTPAAVERAAVAGSVLCVAAASSMSAVSCMARAEKRLAALAVVAGVVGGGETGTKEPRLEASEAGRHGSSWNRILCISSLHSQLSFRSAKELGSSGGEGPMRVCGEGVDGDWLGGVTAGTATKRVLG